MLNTWMSKPQLPGQGEQGRRLGIKHGLNRRWETGGHTHTRVFGLFFRFHLRRTRVVGSRSAPLSNGHSRLHPANPLMHKISKVTIPRAMRTAGPRKQRKAKLRGSRAETRTQTPPTDTQLFPSPSPPATVLQLGSVLLSEQKFQSLRRRERRCKVFSQTNGHTTANIMALGYPQARARWSVLPAALSVTV